MMVAREMVWVLGIVMLGLSTGPAVLLSQAMAQPPDTGADLVLWVFPPGIDGIDAVYDAGWAPVGPTQGRLTVLATPSTTAQPTVDHAWVGITDPHLIALCRSGGRT